MYNLINSKKAKTKTMFNLQNSDNNKRINTFKSYNKIGTKC